MRQRCNDAAMTAKRIETTAALSEYAAYMRDHLARRMAQSVEHMHGRPIHHICQALMTAGFDAAEIAPRLETVTRRLQ